MPVGNVATYGQIAGLAGYPSRARQAGHALKFAGPEVPWWRVLNAAGQLRTSPPARQAALLAGEGVQVVNGKVSLKTYRWHPPALAFMQ